MPYAILRTAKLKTFGAIAGSLSHTFRTRETPNADPARFALNEHAGPADPAGVREAIDALLPEKRRKDAVLCIEYFVGASPEFFRNGGDQLAYFTRAVRWLEERHGAANLVSWAIHRDETSPHLVAYVVPIDGAGKLNAKHFLGGKAKLSAMQTDFAARVGASVGLERGIEGSKATHTSIRQYYGALSQPDFEHGRVMPKMLEPRLLEKRLLSKTVESAEQVAERLTRSVNRYYAPVLHQAGTVHLERKRAEEMAKTAKNKAAEVAQLRERLKEAQRLLEAYQTLFLDGLSEDQQWVLADQATEMREHNARAQAAAQEMERRREAARPQQHAPKPAWDDLGFSP